MYFKTCNIKNQNFYICAPVYKLLQYLVISILVIHLPEDGNKSGRNM